MILNRPRRSPGHKRVRGFTLIEVLVALLVLSIGLLGIAGLQLSSVRDNHSAYLRTQASVLANDILDRMRANRTAFRNGSYDLDVSDSPSSPSSGASIAATDLYQWTQALSALLPSGDGQIARTGNVATITVYWNDTRQGGTDVSNYTQFVTVAQL